jgi:hypothetical protein
MIAPFLIETASRKKILVTHRRVAQGIARNHDCNNERTWFYAFGKKGCS